MKLKPFFTTVLLAYIIMQSFSCNDSVKTADENFGIKDCENIDPILRNFEQDALDALDYCFKISKSTDSLYSGFKKLESIEKSTNVHIGFFNYCKSFYLMNIAICHIGFKEHEQADSIIMLALDILDDVEEKNSEVYSLLSVLQGMSINYRSAMTVTVAGEKCKLYSEKAIAANENNPRAYMSFGIYDFHLPKAHGGGKNAETYFIKALELSSKPGSLACLPSWGKDWTYRFLIKHYIKEENTDAAKEYISKALAEFPKNNSFLKMQNEL